MHGSSPMQDSAMLGETLLAWLKGDTRLEQLVEGWLRRGASRHDIQTGTLNRHRPPRPAQLPRDKLGSRPDPEDRQIFFTP